MLELASQGARVMHARAVELGAIYHMPILVASSFADAPGTLIHEGQTVEPTNKVRGISHELGIAKVTVRGLADHVLHHRLRRLEGLLQTLARLVPEPPVVRAAKPAVLQEAVVE